MTGGPSLLVAGGTVVTPAGETPADVRVREGRVAEIGRLLPSSDEEVLDVSGMVVLPGCVDLHVHLADRVNGVPIADDVASGTAVALRGGVTTVVTFATQRAGEGPRAAVERMVAAAADACHCDLRLHLTPTGESWRWDEIATLARAGLHTVKLYTTYRGAGLYVSYPRLEAAMERLAALGLGLLVHCEDERVLAEAGRAAVDAADPRGHGRLRPAAAEVVAVQRVLAAAERTGCRTHVVHVSTAEAAEQVALARGRGAPVSAETCPQYLLLDDTALAPPEGHRLLCTPPLRPPAVRAALETALLAGDLDLLATDHCPFTRQAKDEHRDDFRRVPTGLPGVGALLDLAWELLVVRSSRPLAELAGRVASAPARVAGLAPRKGVITPGADADLLVVDPDGPVRPITATGADAYSPWAGRTTRLALRRVLLGGREVVRDGVQLQPGRPAGELLLDL